MHLVLCHLGDATGLGLAQCLAERAPDRVELVTVEALCAAFTWEHRIASDFMTFRVSLADGRRLDAAEIDSVLNRVQTVAPVGARTANQDDADYSTQEFTAFFVSWLAGIDAMVVNEVSPLGLSGRHRSRLEWAQLAVAAGLPIAGQRVSTDAALGPSPAWTGSGERPRDTARGALLAAVVGAQCFGDGLPDPLRQGCVALAQSAGLDMLGVEFRRIDGDLRLVDATTMPVLDHSSAEVVDAVAELLGMCA